MTRYTVAELNPETDAAGVCDVWVRNLDLGSAEHAKDKLHHGYLANPAASGNLFALREEGSSVLAGVVGLHPRRFFLGSQEYPATTMADFAVESQHRSAGPALMLMRAALAAGRDRFKLVIGIPNSRSYAICRRAGMAPLGTLAGYTLVGSSRQKLAQRISSRWLPLATPIVDLALRCRLAWKNLGIRPVLSCRDASFDDPSLDRIWSERLPSLLLSDRSASMLLWRYCRKDSRTWRVTLMQESGDIDCGYVIWRMDDGLAVIGDFFSVDPVRLTAALLRAHARHAFATGAHSISASFLGLESVSSDFLRAGYFLAKSPGERLLVATDMSYGELSLSQCYLTTYDNDA